MKEDPHTNTRKTFAPGEAERVLHLVVRRLEEAWPELGRSRPDARDGEPSFLFTGKEGVEVRAGLSSNNEGMAFVDMEVSPRRPHVAVPHLSRILDQLGGRWHWLPGNKRGSASFRLYTELGGAHVSMLGDTVFLGHIIELRKWCEALCPAPQEEFDLAALQQAYKSFEGTLGLVMPWLARYVTLPPALSGWAEEVCDLLSVRTPVGIPGNTPVIRRLALAVLSEKCLAEHTSLGRLSCPSIDPQKLVRLAEEAPGFVAAPIRALAMNSSPYELPDLVNKMLGAFDEAHLPCLFEGAYKDLDSLFHGGQGAESDPLRPAVCAIPDIPLDILIHFALWDQSERLEQPLGDEVSIMAEEIRAALPKDPAEAQRLLAPVVTRALEDMSGREPLSEFASRLSGHTETFGAIGLRPKRARSGEAQHCFQQGLISPEFRSYLGERLFGQKDALDAYVERLQEEALTRPLHQPLAIALQGTPGTGKSECLALTARYLGLPHVVVDVASIPDSYTGMAQLLGSGRGIVGSYQAGRLEQVARHYRGAVVEIADIDHAVPSVRSALGDLFLQILQNGEAQAAVGNMFSCAGLLLGFTLNLPGGKDERAYQRVGFGGAPTMEDVRREVQKEIKNMVSGAFLSRLGEPILFAPLSESARTAIVEHALSEAARALLERLGHQDTEVEFETGTAREMARHFDAATLTFGARGLVDLARRNVVRVLLPWSQAGQQMPSLLHLGPDDAGRLQVMEPHAARPNTTSMNR